MSTKEANWWAFSVGSDLPEVKDSKLRGDLDVNPLLGDDQLQLLDYHTYVGLDKLLDSQVPCSTVPDERIFIITHQMFELAFKQMIFDCAVIARTFELLLEAEDATLTALSLGSENKDANSFWRSAITASGRLKFTSEEVLPKLLSYMSPFVGDGHDRLELFSPEEFKRFRAHLTPASGFQTAQFRLIQTALGKGNLLGVRLFPSQKFQRCYLGKDKVDGLPLRLTDELVLRAGYALANPSPESSPALVARLDELAHKLLSRLPASETDGAPEIAMLPSEESALELLVQGYVEMVRRLAVADGVIGSEIALAAGKFKDTWKNAIAAENDRRKSLTKARSASVSLLKMRAPDSQLMKILDRLVDTDRALHGRVDGNGKLVGGFLNSHRHTAGRQISTDPKSHDGGTSGGGTPYLQFSTDYLFQMFPALIAYSDLTAARPPGQEVAEAVAEAA